MKKDKYKILVLSDLKKSTQTILKSTVSLAKMIQGDIEFFHIKKPTDVVEKENQLSAIRTINSEYRKTEKKIQNIITPISNEFGINIPYSFTFGNIKDEILSYINEHKPDIIVLGKKKSKAFNIIGDNVTDFILKNHEGVIMIAANENGLEPDKELALGVLNNIEEAFNLEFSNSLLAHSQKPLKCFKIINKSNDLKETNGNGTDTDTIEFVFEQSDNAMSSLSNYLVKSKVNLLCLNRGVEKAKKVPSVNSDVKDVISKLKVSLLLAGKQNQISQKSI
ncbi:universal stress protein [Mariniflexile sp.]|uniref:universal stress protein n=1 Tax=Mariniflexile sp. TaxID=1979402 RepID=UPI003561B51C